MNTVIITYYLFNLTGFRLKSCFQKNHNFNQPHLNFRYTRLNYIVCKILYIYHSPMLDADCLVWLVILELVPEGIVISKCFNSQARMKDDANWMSRCRREMESRINSPARKDAYGVVKDGRFYFVSFGSVPDSPDSPLGSPTRASSGAWTCLGRNSAEIQSTLLGITESAKPQRYERLVLRGWFQTRI